MKFTHAHTQMGHTHVLIVINKLDGDTHGVLQRAICSKGEFRSASQAKNSWMLERIMGNGGSTVPEGFGGHVSSRDAVIDERLIPHWIQCVL